MQRLGVLRRARSVADLRFTGHGSVAPRDRSSVFISRRDGLSPCRFPADGQGVRFDCRNVFAASVVLLARFRTGWLSIRSGSLRLLTQWSGLPRSRSRCHTRPAPCFSRGWCGPSALPTRPPAASAWPATAATAATPASSCVLPYRFQQLAERISQRPDRPARCRAWSGPWGPSAGWVRRRRPADP